MDRRCGYIQYTGMIQLAVWDRNGPTTVARLFQGLDCGIPGWRGSSVDSTEMQLRIHTRPSTAIHKARSGGAACSVQHTASCRTLHACRRRVLIALVANVCMTLLLVPGGTLMLWMNTTLRWFTAAAAHALFTLVLRCCFAPRTVYSSTASNRNRNRNSVRYCSCKYGSSQSWRPRRDARTAGLVWVLVPGVFMCGTGAVVNREW